MIAFFFKNAADRHEGGYRIGACRILGVCPEKEALWRERRNVVFRKQERKNAFK
jgi:hypothetical protein